MKWQPIETAPRDGTKIDVFMDGKRFTDVFWDYSYYIDSEGLKVVDDYWKGWRKDGETGMSYTPNYLDNMGKAVSHWMPLPITPTK